MTEIQASSGPAELDFHYAPTSCGERSLCIFLIKENISL
jgi:hypothetical protein